MAKMLVFDPKKCTGCRLCELACSFRMEGEFNPTRSRVQVAIFDEEAFYTPLSCFQCDEAWCRHACPAAAITRDPALLREVVNPVRCVGCRICTLACPFGQVMYNAATGKVYKCELCDGDPACVKFCPTGALTYQEQDTAVMAKRQAWSRRLIESYQEVRT